MAKIKNNESVGVLNRACDTDTVATTAGSDVVGIDTHSHHAVHDIPQTSILRTGFVHVVDIAMGWVVLLVQG